MEIKQHRQDAAFFQRLIWAGCVVLVALITWGIVSEFTKPVITDPTAQRIWAATHANVAMSASEVERLLQVADSAGKVQ